MIQVNAIGDACPIPVVKTKQAIRELGGTGVVQTLVDNEIAVQNLTKMASQKGYAVRSDVMAPNQFLVTMTIGSETVTPVTGAAEAFAPRPQGRDRNIVVAIASASMGQGDAALGATLMKGFIYALSQQDSLPTTLLFYHGGAAFTCEGSASLEDLQAMHSQGVEVLTCGTCLNFYGLTAKLKVGEVSNMYTIAEKLTQADLVIKP